MRCAGIYECTVQWGILRRPTRAPRRRAPSGARLRAGARERRTLRRSDASARRAAPPVATRALRTHTAQVSTRILQAMFIIVRRRECENAEGLSQNDYFEVISGESQIASVIFCNCYLCAVQLEPQHNTNKQINKYASGISVPLERVQSSPVHQNKQEHTVCARRVRTFDLVESDWVRLEEH